MPKYKWDGAEESTINIFYKLHNIINPNDYNRRILNTIPCFKNHENKINIAVGDVQKCA